MITDNLKNINLYANIPEDVKLFIKNISSSMALGKYGLGGDNYANVELYSTKSLADAKYEAHEKYIDIQILLSGCEKIYYSEKDTLTFDIPYDSQRDIAFYKEAVEGNYIELNGSNFVVLFPHEAHAPQVQSGNTSEQVLKVVVKIKV